MNELSRQSFPSTLWSVVLRAGSADTATATVALGRLCEAYWYPLYSFLRHRGNAPADAEDLTQGFLTHLLEKHALGRVGPDRGRFRTFLLAALKNFLANEYDRATALKRGGGKRIVSLSTESAELRYRSEPRHEQTPERHFERQWALTLLDGVLAVLANEYAVAGRGELFEALKPSLVGDSKGYAVIAERVGMTEGAIKAAAYRLRQRYRLLLIEAIAETVGEGDVDNELRHLMAALG